jgi:hypothetical protein
LSEPNRKTPAGGTGPRRRQRGPARPSKRAAAVAVPPGRPVAANDENAPTSPPPASTRSARFRRTGASGVQTFTLSRVQEMAYIRSDMQRLFVIAGALLALMLVILLLSNR